MTIALDLLANLADPQLALRMGLVAVFVVLVALVAERLGPFLGAMVASLPLYTGPIYLMLALEHDAAYLWAAAHGSLAICGATPVFALVYCLLARRRGVLASLGGALVAWTGCAGIVQSSTWTLAEALLFIAPIYAVAVPMARGFTRGIAVKSAKRGWIDLPLRAVLCGGFAGVVIAASRVLPPQLTGLLAVPPVLLTSLILVLHPRIGGPATAVLLAHTLSGLVGMVLAFVLVILTIETWGVPPSLLAGLAVTIAWNIGLILAKRKLSGRPTLPPPAMPPRPR